MIEIRKAPVDGVMKTCIRLGDENVQIPKHMMQGEKMRGILATADGQEKPWTWDGLTSIDGDRYVYFDEIDIESLDCLATNRRDRALEIVTRIADILSHQKEDFVSPLVGIIPLWRIYVVDGDGLLILPPDLGDLISIYMSTEDQFAYHGCFVRSSTEAGFSMIRQMGQLLYYALTGIKPYEKQEVRDAGYHEIPLSIYKDQLFARLDDKSLGFIDFTLHAKEREQRDIMGNRKAHENLDWFVKRSRELSWDVDRMDASEAAKKAEAIASSPAVKEIMEKTVRSAKRRTFWRQRGSMIAVLAIVAILVGTFAGTWIASVLEPPTTRDLDQEGVILAFYDAQNRLDTDGIQTATKGCSAPQESEVISMYVTRQTRVAYEATDPLVPVETWIEAGEPAIPSSSYIYGITDLELTSTGVDSWHVTGSYYTPYAYNEEEEVAPESIPSGQTVVYVYDMSQDFSFAWNGRGWWNITDISPMSVQLDEVRYVETYEPQRIL